MDDALLILNTMAVSVFGCVLSAAFCGLGRTGRSRIQVAAVTFGLLLLQGVYYGVTGSYSVRMIYPLLTHLPLALLLCLLTGKRVWPFGSVFLAYLCCQLRRWVGLLVVMVADGGDQMLEAVEIIITVPILLLLLKYVVGPAQEISHLPPSTQLYFFLIPLLYYIYDYLTVVYTDWLYSGTPAVVEFMPFVCCALYLFFLLKACGDNRRYGVLERDRDTLRLQVGQSVRELEVLREAQRQGATYRHDLRHHLQFLSSCIENGENDRAQDYIRNIDREIDAQKVVPFCENEPVNLILSAYTGWAAKAGVETDIRVVLPPYLGISANDLCVLLSNGLENALHACAPLATAGEKPRIQVRGYERNGRTYLQISNPVGEEVKFRDGCPVTNEEGHGIGTRSIQAIVERYDGLCSFTVEEGKFVLRASL